jgi:hypothetical protein
VKPPIVDTPVEPNSAVSHHSLQDIDGYVGRFFLNVSFQVLQSLWAVVIDTGFQIPPQKSEKHKRVLRDMFKKCFTRISSGIKVAFG